MPRQWRYLCQYPKEVPRGTQRLPPQFLPTSGAAEAGRRMKGQGTVKAASTERSHGRAYRGPRSGLSLFVRCATLRSDTWTGPDLGLSAGGGQITPRGCSNGDRKASSVLWARSGAAEGRGWCGAGSGLSLLGRSGRGRRRNGRGLVWGWGRKGAGAGAGGGVGVRAGGVRRAGLTSGASRSEFALQHSWQVSAERKVPGARGSGTIRTCGDHAPRTWCGSVAASRCPPGHGAREVRVSRPQRPPVSRRAEDRVGARSRARCLSGPRRERLGARWLRLCCCSPPCLQPFRRAPRARCSRACE